MAGGDVLDARQHGVIVRRAVEERVGIGADGVELNRGAALHHLQMVGIARRLRMAPDEAVELETLGLQSRRHLIGPGGVWKNLLGY